VYWLVLPIQTLIVYLWLFLSCLFGLLVSPLRWKDPDLNYSIGRLFAWIARPVCRLDVELLHGDRLEARQPCVYVANHQSSLDVITFAQMLPHRTLGIGKIELIWIPFFGQYLYTSGNILIRRQSRTHSLSGMSQAARAIQERQVNVMVFAEGTRNAGPGMLPFKKGAFHLAIEAQVPIVPIVHSPLKKIPRQKTRVTIEVLEPIETRGLKRDDIDHLLQQTRERMLAAFNRSQSSPI
jgi:1-acyl-sn-glycerol-3-phosphate acyltransferase